MFFGRDESPYVSRFVEFTERLGSFASDSKADEDARLAAARGAEGDAARLQEAPGGGRAAGGHEVGRGKT